MTFNRVMLCGCSWAKNIIGRIILLSVNPIFHGSMKHRESDFHFYSLPLILSGVEDTVLSEDKSQSSKSTTTPFTHDEKDVSKIIRSDSSNETYIVGAWNYTPDRINLYVLFT